MTGYREIASDLLRRITQDPPEWLPGERIPSVSDLMTEYGAAKYTVRQALADLEDSGWLVLRDRARAVVRTRTRVVIPLSRYGAVMTPGGTRGPWEEACAQQGLDGVMQMVQVKRMEAPDDVSGLLGIAARDPVMLRERHALLDGEVVQVQRAWYTHALVAGTPLEREGKITGGVLGALVGAGLVPDEADETVWCGPPEADEIDVLEIGSGVPVLRVQRVTRSRGTPFEVLRISAPSDRVELVYDRLPLRPA